MTEFQQARGLNHNLDCSLDLLKHWLDNPKEMERHIRIISALMAPTLQGTALTQFGSQVVAEAFCVSRLAPAIAVLLAHCPMDLT